MLVNVEQIREDGLELDEPLERTFLAEALGEALFLISERLLCYGSVATEVA